MCDAAAHLVDHVLPDVPVRQWVLTAPHEVRSALALRPDALTAQGRIFVEEIARWQKHAARTRGETGVVTLVQRFNSILGCFVHFHVLVPDGVFTRTDGVFTRTEGDGSARGRRAIVADISDSEVVVALLAHLGLPTEAPPVARARSRGFDCT